MKTLDRIEISEHPCPGGVEYRFDLAARSFLHNQVRSIVGTLERVGAGAWTPGDVRAALEVIRALDQPRMRGRFARRLTPANAAT